MVNQQRLTKTIISEIQLEVLSHDLGIQEIYVQIVTFNIRAQL